MKLDEHIKYLMKADYVNPNVIPEAIKDLVNLIASIAPVIKPVITAPKEKVHVPSKTDFVWSNEE